MDLQLILGALLLGTALGLAGGRVCAWRPRSRTARALHALTAFQLSCPPYFQAIVILFWFSNGSGDIVQIPFVSGQGDFVPFSDDPLRYLQAMWVPWLLAALPLAALVLLINAAAIEYGFGIPGLFRLIRAAVSSQDVAVLEAMVVEGVILVVFANFLADAVHARLDPRLSHR